MPPRCKHCKEGETVDKPLFAYTRCSRHYHSAYHRPHPRETTHWVGKRCLADEDQVERRARFDHDNQLSNLSSRAAFPSAAASPASPTDTMAPSTALFPSQHKEASSQSVAPAIACPFPGCSAKIDSRREVLCQAHLPTLSKKDWNQDAVSTNGAHTVPPATASLDSAAQQFIPASKSRKLLLSETGKDHPIMRRKTAGAPFIPQQPTPKHSTPPSRGDASMSPLSPQPAASHVPVHSPPASPPPLQNGEPPKKRQRVSSAMMPSTEEPRTNGTSVSRPSVTDTESENKPTESDGLPASQSVPKHSPQRQGKRRKSEGKNGLKPKAENSIKKMLMPVKLQFSWDDVPSVAQDQSKPTIYGFKENFSPRSHEERTPSPDRVRERNRMKDMNNSVPFAVHLDSVSNSPRPAQKTPNGNGPRPLRPLLPNGEKPDIAPVASVSTQINGNTRSKSLPQTGIFPFRPAPSQIPVSQPPRKMKEVDLAVFDALIYSQDGAITPPPGISLNPPTPISPSALSASAITPHPIQNLEQEPKVKPEPDEPVFGYIDPRIHWPQRHSEAWHAAKQEEIKARGGRKANFGKAAQSLRKQNQKQLELGLEFKDSLPEKIAQNPAWVRALRRLKGLPVPEEDEGNVGGGVEAGRKGGGRNRQNGFWGNGR